MSQSGCPRYTPVPAGYGGPDAARPRGAVVRMDAARAGAGGDRPAAPHCVRATAVGGGVRRRAGDRRTMPAAQRSGAERSLVEPDSAPAHAHQEPRSAVRTRPRPEHLSPLPGGDAGARRRPGRDRPPRLHSPAARRTAGTTWGRQVITEQVASSCRAHRRWNAGGDAPKRYVDLPEHVSKTLCSVGAADVRRRRRRGRA